MAKQIDMTKGKLAPLILKFALPLMATNLLQMLFNVADSLIVGRYGGEIPLAAVGSNSSIINLFLNIFVGISVAVGVITAQAIGARDEDTQGKMSQTAFIMGLEMGLGVAIVGFFISRYFIRALGCPPDVIDQATLYLKIYFWGSPFVVLYNNLSSIIRATGDTKSPLIYLIISGLTNVILNYIFVAIFKIYVPGVAIATIISQAVSAVLVTLHLVRLKGPLKLKFKNLKIDKALFIKSLKIGVPSGIQGMMFSISNMILQKGINSLGSDAMAGSTAANNIEACVYFLFYSVAIAGMNFMGQNYGAKQYKRMPRIIWTCMAIQFIVGIICVVTILPIRHFLVSQFIPGKENAIAYGVDRLLIVVSLYFVCGFMDTFAYCLRGIGVTLSPCIVFGITACGFRVIWVFTIFQLPKWHNIIGLFTIYPITWAVPGIILAIEFFHIYKKLLRGEELHAKATNN